MYRCERCGYETIYKSTFSDHLHRKNPCNAIHKDVPLSEMLPLLERKVGSYKCEGCESVFKNPQAKYQHKKKCASFAQSLILVEENKTSVQGMFQELKQENQELKQEIEILKASVGASANVCNAGRDMVSNQNDNRTIDNSVNDNKTVNVYINDFGNENISYLPKEFLSECFARKDLITLLENIHCDRDHPENHNIRVKSQKRNQIEVREREKWMIKDENEALEEAIKNGYRILVRHGYKHKREIIDDQLEDEDEYYDIRNWLDEIYESNTERKPIQRKMLLLLLSNQALLLGKDE